MIDTVIFDLDGTLLNTLEDLCDSTNYALSVVGCPKRTIGEVRSFVGEGVRLLIERALPADKRELTNECLKIFSAHYDKNKENKTRLYDGIEQMLDSVKKSGYKSAIVSNKYDAAVQELKRTRFKQIDCAVGESPALNKKPAPDMVHRALELLKSRKENAVYVGDSDVDIKCARNSGLPVIAVSWGFRPRSLLKELKADIIIDEPRQLIGAIDALNAKG